MIIMTVQNVTVSLVFFSLEECRHFVCGQLLTLRALGAEHGLVPTVGKEIIGRVGNYEGRVRVAKHKKNNKVRDKMKCRVPCWV